ncbi:ATP-binding protein [Tritonibacter horizontis]|uniref:Acetyl-/propionyl-coenzyme A carboxylase alpha chain n=1 Tax=Tritonibacter horizontis TaxID=1768241 RepID=A0A132C1D8_9RHOB|nr:biotin carboxylase N-terminal domain-containing protein [Tritonibacter horizontis]KUP94409.1 acetyl-/propionyl-coenzyme A carboxylase alpha chain [Tritonibacter horizontis]
MTRPPKTGPFTRLLIANRGEIALRILRSARAMGITCVTVHTRADADSPHVRLADDSLCIGEGPPADSYLSIAALIAAARTCGAQAIHPGYGLLSENAGFATACDRAELIFIGPSAEAIARMANKSGARQHMAAAGLPCVPGYDGADQAPGRLADEAARIGYPVMIKASNGGGGRGMRLAEGPYAFDTALRQAQAEAATVFGSGHVLLEKALDDPRHVEVQILADAHGTLLHLGERDCSVQRRHQKVIEEAPAPGVTPALRAEMGAAAITAARSIGYVGAGTVEFLLDSSGRFHFIEMNTRLQVEHAVTEAITGVDLVQEQLRIAQGSPLGRAQDDIRFEGHAIEARLYGEDPAENFAPQAGRLALWQPGEGVRVDAGVESGQVLSTHFEPLLAKLIAHGRTRDDARLSLRRALQQTLVFGVTSNRDMLIDALGHPAFASAAVHTGFLAEHFPRISAMTLSAGEIAVGAALFYWRAAEEAAAQTPHVPPELRSWSSQGALNRQLRLRATQGVLPPGLAEADGAVILRVEDQGDQLQIRVGVLTLTLARDRDAKGQMRILLDGAPVRLRAQVFDGAQLHLATEQRIFALMLCPKSSPDRSQVARGELHAPHSGRLQELRRGVGDLVQEGEVLLVLHGVSGPQDIRAGQTGRIVALPVVAGDQVLRGDLLCRIVASEGAVEAIPAAV